MRRLLVLALPLALVLPPFMQVAAAPLPVPPKGGCRYVEAGLPGPAGNRLQVDRNIGGVGLSRDGRAIVVYSPFTEPEAILDCAGPPAMVDNVDLIVYRPPGGGDPPRIAHQLRVDLSGGLLQPGASRDRHGGGNEIEILADFPKEPPNRWSRIYVTGSDGGDWVRVGALGRSLAGVNLNLRHDRNVYDADLIVAADVDAHFILKGEGGDDRFGSTGMGSEFVGPIPQPGLALRGGDGSDTILGGPRRESIMGDAGADTIYAGGGNDRLWGDDGNDRLFGGSGRDELLAGFDEVKPFYDFLSGGGGRDSLRALDRNTDAVTCGGGTDHAYLDGIDEWDGSSCENTHGPDFN